MGLYGSPQLGPFTEEDAKIKQTKKDGYKPQTNIWVWAVIIIINFLIFLVSSKTIGDILTLLVLDSMVIFGISIVSLIVNVVKKRKIGNDIKFIGISVIAFFISALILGTL